MLEIFEVGNYLSSIKEVEISLSDKGINTTKNKHTLSAKIKLGKAKEIEVSIKYIE